MRRIIGIDLGSSNTIVYLPRKGIVFNEPTVVSYTNDNKKAVNVGYLAFKQLGKTSDNVKVIRPIQNGVVYDGPACMMFLNEVLKQLGLLKGIKKTTFIISTPSNYSQIEHAALINVLTKIGAKSVVYRSSSYLSAIGVNEASASSKSVFVCNIGGGITDISVISNNQTLYKSTTSFSGKMLDDAIIRLVKKNHQLIISSKTAEYIKMKIGTVETFPENKLLEVSGIDLVSSLPHSVIISSTEIKQVLMNSISYLTDAITDALELISPDVASDVIESGIILCGGASLLTGLREYLENKVNVSVRLAPTPTTTTIQGIKILVQKLEEID